MKAFVTGGAGFIGSHLVDYLLSLGWKVSVYDNLSSGKMDFVLHNLNNPGFKFTKEDLLNSTNLTESIKGHDLVFHLSANPEPRLSHVDTSLDLNQEIVATYNLLEAMRKNSINKIIFASSSVVYGEGSQSLQPIPEDFGPLFPVSLYGAGKMASEGLISAYCGTFGFQAWIFRFANIVGGRATHGVIYDFTNKLLKNKSSLEILGNGKQEKTYLHVSDCVKGIMYGFLNSNQQINYFNLGSESTVCVLKIAEIVIDVLSLKDVRLSFTGGDRGWPGDVPLIKLDVNKMRKLGWEAGIDGVPAIRLAAQQICKQLNAPEVY